MWWCVVILTQEKDRIEVLIKTLKSPVRKEREEAVYELVKMRDPRVVKALIQALKDEDYEVRKAVSSVLPGIVHRGVKAFIEALEDPDRGVQLYAISVLGSIGDPRAIEPLIKLQSRGDRVIAIRTQMALNQIARKHGFSHIKEIVKKLKKPLADEIKELLESKGIIDLSEEAEKRGEDPFVLTNILSLFLENELLGDAVLEGWHLMTLGYKEKLELQRMKEVKESIVEQVAPFISKGSKFIERDYCPRCRIVTVRGEKLCPLCGGKLLKTKINIGE